MTWTHLLFDDRLSPVFDELHARIDNYQIYSIAWCDQTVTSQTTHHKNAISLPPVQVITSRAVSLTFLPPTGSPTAILSRGRTYKYYSRLIPNDGTTYSVLQTVDLVFDGDDDPARTISRKIPDGGIVTFDPSGWNLDGEYIVADEPVSYTYSSQVQADITYGYSPETHLGNRGSLIIADPPITERRKIEACIAFQSFDVHARITQDFSKLITDYPTVLDRQKGDYIHLITGHELDTRIMPDEIIFVAPRSMTLTYSFYRKNIYETHPRVIHSLDYVHRKIRLKSGKTYRLDVKQIVLGTLLMSNPVIGALIRNYTKLSQYPARFLFVDNVASLMSYWHELYPLKPPATPRLASSFTLTEGAAYPPDLVFAVTESNSIPIPIILAANNNYWGWGSSTIDVNKPPPTHPLFVFNYIKLFETLQPDNSYGTYVMDSIRLIEMQSAVKEIYDALDAGNYASYTDENGQKIQRVTNLGWLIEKTANILGLRRKPNGKYLDAADQSKYDRNRLNSPKWPQGDYDLNSWGNKGYALRHIPTTYNDGQRQDNMYDLVHDIPQFLAAILDQIDLGQGLQHTAEIRLKVGKEVQSYPNVGQLTIDLAARVIELEALVQKIAVMQIETSNSVRELFPGIGIPVATKSVSIDIGGKQQQVFYPGFQSGKGSILDNLSAIKVNLGIALGQLMPQKKPDSRWNPFDRKPKS